MKLIHSKDIYYVTKDILRLQDPKVLNHGQRTAYILYKMLQCIDKYEMYEIAEFAFIATLHDIGAYRTNYQQDPLRYESKEYMPHSIYGYLYFLYLTPFKDRAKILLYHHTDFNQVPKAEYEYTDIIHYLNVAEKMDMYSNILGSKFDYMMFQKQAGTKYSPKALEVLYQAEKKFSVFEKLASGEYVNELDELFEYLIFTNKEKEEIVLGVMYCVSFRSEYTMFDTVTCMHICEQLGEILLLPKDEVDLLYYAALFHDAGMSAISRDILEAPRKLTDEEMHNLRRHVNIIEEILKDKVSDYFIEIISAHHERGDGSGYPKKLRDFQMNRLQHILQVADVVTGLTSPRSYRKPKEKEQVIEILSEEMAKGKLNSEIVRTFITFYDKIMDGVKRKNNETLAMYNKLEENFELTSKQIK